MEKDNEQEEERMETLETNEESMVETTKMKTSRRTFSEEEVSLLLILSKDIYYVTSKNIKVILLKSKAGKILFKTNRAKIWRVCSFKKASRQASCTGCLKKIRCLEESLEKDVSDEVVAHEESPGLLPPICAVSGTEGQKTEDANKQDDVEMNNLYGKCDSQEYCKSDIFSVCLSEGSQQQFDMICLSQESTQSFMNDSQVSHLNTFMENIGLQLFSTKDRNRWASYSDKSRKRYIERLWELFYSIFTILFPYDADSVAKEFRDVHNKRDSTDLPTTNTARFEDIVESYKKAETWQQDRQVLSVLASSLPYREVVQLLPEVTSHRYYAALNHAKNVGSALPVPEKDTHRQKMDPVKLDSFLDFITSSHVVKDLPYGEKKMKMKDGSVHIMLNLVRCMGSSDIIHQYKVYCAESEISPLGDSTMFRILSECGATVRKSLEGLDYFIAEGGRAFLTIQKCLDQLLTKSVLSKDRHRDLQALLMQTKNYLRTDYKIHVSRESEVADHCMLYALNDERYDDFSANCTHLHKKVCESCEQHKETMEAILEIFQSTEGDEINDIQYKIQQAINSIRCMKQHLIRCQNQDLAKSELFDTMPSDEILLICDWAMKFLPRKFREDQCDWFAKRGIPWHITMAFCRKDDGTIGSLGSVHLFSNQTSQDSTTTAAVLKDVMQSVQSMSECPVKFHIWSDNAGCYKSTEMMSFLYQSGLVVSYNFCEAQNGKGPCDRTAATIKSAIRRYVNQGHDVLTAFSMKKAVDSSMKNVKYRVCVVEGVENSDKSCLKPIPAIASYNNFTFTCSHGIRMWKAYQVGRGKLIEPVSIGCVEEYRLKKAAPADE